jgi:hypothetical protein
LSEANGGKISQLCTTNHQISELIWERITAKAWGVERISNWMPDLVAMIIALNNRVH